ncbi:MAG TPA: phenylalanine--tRNA ligase subunit beta [Myxococcales bacterium]|nr:phenylalanine--tRNA ligase subunit beta [Myxococcales bacterium]
MRISLGWLAELVDLPEERALVDGLTGAGLPVDKVERLGESLAGVVVARILESHPHPKADRLSVTTVDAGAEKLQIVCGAKNYRVGDLVPLARVGTSLPDGHRIEAAKLRGVESFGMLCSQKELALSEDHEGLWILPPELTPGAELATALSLRDTVLELDLTPNRGDCLSHLGVAREVAAIFSRPLRTPQALAASGRFEGTLPAPPVIEAPTRCGRYQGLAVGGRNLTSRSPPWMSARLEACGVRAINLAVDVTNYVLLELGQPLHAFDLAALKAGVRVRLARGEEKLRTLDGADRILSPDDLLICDGERPLALAGVMGGEASGVAAGTAALYVEAAWFEPRGVARSARRHGLHSESSHRFERGVDPELPPRALARLVALLARAGAEPAPAPAQLAEGTLPARRSVSLRYERVGQLLGDPVPSQESRGVLERLGFGIVEEGPGQVRADVPTFRFDVEGEADLIEEVGRLRGYDSIPATLPGRALPPPREPPQARPLAAARAALEAQGFSEAVNYAFLAGPATEPFRGGTPVALQNPLKSEQGALRTSLLPGLCLNLRGNLAHLSQVAGALPAVRLYETGRTYRWPEAGERPEGPLVERPTLSFVACGTRMPIGWATTREVFDFFDLRGIVDALVERAGIDGAEVAPAAAPFLHPRSASALSIGGKGAGLLGELHPEAARVLDLPPGVFVAELDAEVLFAGAKVPRFRGVPRFPAVLRDIALVVPEATSSEAVSKLLRREGGPLLEAAILFDVYRGPPLREGTKSLAFSLRLRAPDRTLRDEEAEAVQAALVAAARQALGATLRA